MDPGALETSLRLLLFSAVALSLLAWTGYGPTALLLPPSLRQYGLLLIAPLGYCWFAISSSALNSTFLPMTWATLVILLAATGVNAFTWRRHRVVFPLTREVAAVYALAAVPFIIGVLPLIRAGSTAFLGQQWDLEVYLPITEYLKRYAIGDNLDALPNPLTRLLNAPDFRGGSGWGFSYVEAGIGTLLGWPSFLTFRPLLQLLMTLSLPCIYFLARVTLGVDRRAALVAAALWSVNGLGIWLASIGLAGHAASFFLLPLALALSFRALEDAEWRTIVLAGAAAAGLVLSFYTGGLPFYALPVAAYGLLRLVHAPDRRRTFVAGLSLVAAVLLLAPVAHLRFLATLSLYFGKGLTQGWGITEFSPFAEALGLTPFVLIQHTTELGVILGESGMDWLLGTAWDLTRAAVVLALVGLWSGPLHRQRLVALLLPGLLLALGLRFGMQYAYGYFKALSLLAPFLLVPVAVGAVAAWDLAGRLLAARTLRFPARAVLVGIAAVFVGVTLFTTHLSVRYFWKPSPEELPREVWQLQEMKKLLPEGAPVKVLSRSGFNPRTAGMVSYFLMDNPLDGSLQIAYNQMTPRAPGQFQYIVLLDGVQPPEAGLDPGGALWRNGLAALYRVPDNWQGAAYLEGGDRMVTVSAESGPAELRLDPDGWAVAVPGAPAVVEQQWWRNGQKVQPELTLLSVTGGRFSFAAADGPQEVILKPGLHTYRLRPATTPAVIELAATGPGERMTVLAARMLTPLDAGGALVSVQGIAAIEVKANVEDSLSIELDFASPDPRGGDVVASLEVYQHAPNGTFTPFSSWELAHAGRIRSGRTQFRLDPATWTCEGGREDSQAPPDLHSGTPPPDGQYSAHLALYHMADDVARWPWLNFTVRNGVVTVSSTSVLPALAVAYLPAPREVRALRALLPEGAAVLVVPDPDPDRSFVTAAAGFLEGRRVFADAPLFRDGLEVAEPAWVHDYALLPADADPGDYGYGPSGLRWRNRFARLYERTDGSPTALFRFPSGLDVSPGQTLRLALAPGGARLDLPDGTSLWGSAPPSGGVDVEFTLINQRVQPVVVEVPSPTVSAAATSAAARVAVAHQFARGVVVHRQAGLTLASHMVFRPEGDSPVTLASIRIVPSSGQPSGPTVLDRVMAVQTGPASATQPVGLSFEAVNSTSASAAVTVAGVDIYSRGQCRLTHFGYWALVAPDGSANLDFALDPALKRGAFTNTSGTPLPLDHQAWPSGNGLFRGVAFVRAGDVTRSLPAFQFRLSDSGLTHVESLSRGRLHLLHGQPPSVVP